MRRLLLPLLLLAAAIPAAGIAVGDHVIGLPPCPTCASHDEWPRILAENAKRTDKEGTTTLVGTAVSDQLMGHHTSDTLRGEGGSDVIWGDYDPNGQPASQVDKIWGGEGEDFIYGSHGRNVIRAGAGNDAISVHYGRGVVNCGAGRDIYHVARSRKSRYTFKNCEKVDYRTESQRGGGLRPLP
ncbi:MAG: hypothetical protein M3320_05510 [Actinomycetota bacterium]|nr:hypothetical protein [Actinomycetota bacterium]MDQ5808116.1 hypothetical protein [Actinomycetota bacterium]